VENEAISGNVGGVQSFIQFFATDKPLFADVAWR